MKIFTWDEYDGRDIVLCGPLRRCICVLRSFPPDFKSNVVICDNNALEKSLLPEWNGDITVRNVKFISREELVKYSSSYVFLVGKTFYKDYLVHLGYKTLDDFYSATAIINDGLVKSDYFMYFTSLYRKRREGVYLGGVEVVLTSRCTLRCRDCANLMQYYTHHEKINRTVLLKALGNLIESVDGIAALKILGGEPLLEEDLLSDILTHEEFWKNGKVLGIQIITNGTILFSERLLKSIKNNPLAMVYLSNYGLLSSKESEIRKQLDSLSVPYSEVSEDAPWFDYGNPTVVHQKGGGAKKLFVSCWSKDVCLTILDGKLYSCPRAAHGERIGIYPRLESESVDLLDEKELGKRVYNFYYREKEAYACSYCTNYQGKIINKKAIQA